HGDTLCIDDLAYQKARIKMHDPAFRRSVLAKPLFFRKLMALYYRYQSYRHKTQSSLVIMDANPEEVQRVMDAYQINLLI
ncbi:hypothetical protein ABTA35_20430, partial [Acinetobacter baumannii]